MSARRIVTGGVAASAAVALALLLALWALGEALSVWIVVGVVAFAVIATIPWVGTVTLQAACAAVIALLALVGFNVVLGWLIGVLPDGLVDPTARLPIPLGVVLAFGIFWATAYFYLRGTWIGAFPRLQERVHATAWLRNPTAWKPRKSLVTSGLLAAAAIIVLPPTVAVLRAAGEEPRPLPTPTRIGADLDVHIVASHALPESGHIPPDPARAGFLPAYRRAVDLDVRFAVGFADQATVRWTRVAMTGEAEARAALSERGTSAVPAPQRRAGADVVVVLLVDATPAVVLEPETLEDVAGDDDEVERWRAVAESVGAPDLPVVALLQTSDERRLRRWASFEDVGEVVSIKQLGSQTVTDAAVRLGVGRPTGAGDFELAMRHRPILLFDAGEPTPRPLSIEHLFRDRRVHQCDRRRSGGSCETEPLRGPADLRSPGTYLRIDRPPGLRRLARQELEAWQAGGVSLRSGQASEQPSGSRTVDAAVDASGPGAPPPGTPPPTLPPGVPPAPTGETLLGDGSRMYVNAVPVRQGKQQLLYLDYWWYLAENPTGAVKGALCGAGMVILGVTCLDHESDWEGMTLVLERRRGRAEPIAAHYAQHESVVRYDWQALRAHWDRDTTLQDVFARLGDHADRPVVWVARGTHAGYARRCQARCRQVAADLEEQPHDGGLPWVGNDSAVCLRVGCLLSLPTAAGGRGPASWNAFAGPWGSRRCWLQYFCDSATPPPAPGAQDRYQDPARYDGTGDVTDRGGGFMENGP